MADVCELSAVALARRLGAGELTAEEVCAAFLERAALVDEEVNCFIAIDDAEALRRARALDRAPAARRGALHGVPFGVKDIFALASTSPTAGSARVRLRLRHGSSAVIERLEAAGGLRLGRLNLDPLAYAATGANPDFGDTLNPWEVGHLAGGSSSGAAAAVAARALPFAIGSDTGGSVRIPAALCGVVGLKPTFGRISRRGALPLSYSQDTIGILARSAADAAVVLDQIAGYDAEDPASLDVAATPTAAAAGAPDAALRGLRIGVDRGRLAADCQPDRLAAVDAAIDVLAGLGARIVEVDLSRLSAYDLAASVITQAESAAVHGSALLDAPEDYPSTIRARLTAAMACLGSDHVDALRYQGHALREMLDGPLAAADVLVVAAAGGRPPRAGALEADGDAVRASLELLRLHRPFSLTGLPALSLPVGFDSAGLPIGVQLAGRPWGEATVLACAAAYQAATGWHEASPTLAVAPMTEGEAA